MSRTCPPDYTPAECARITREPSACEFEPWNCNREVPEPDILALLFIGGLVAWAVKKFRR